MSQELESGTSGRKGYAATRQYESDMFTGPLMSPSQISIWRSGGESRG